MIIIIIIIIKILTKNRIVYDERYILLIGPAYERYLTA